MTFLTQMRLPSVPPSAVSRVRRPVFGTGEPLRTLRCVRARGINVTGPGSMFDESPKEPIPDEVRRMSAQLMESMKEKIATQLEAAAVEVSDVYGDGQHITINVVAEQFDGKSSMQRQRMVFKSIWAELQNQVHAVDSMVCMTPAELEAASKS